MNFLARRATEAAQPVDPVAVLRQALADAKPAALEAAEGLLREARARRAAVTKEMTARHAEIRDHVTAASGADKHIVKLEADLAKAEADIGRARAALDIRRQDFEPRFHATVKPFIQALAPKLLAAVEAIEAATKLFREIEKTAAMNGLHHTEISRRLPSAAALRALLKAIKS